MRTFRLSLLVVLAAALLAVPAIATAASAKGRYHTNVHVQMAPGYKGPIHKWDPIMVSIRGRGHTGERYDLCMTPAPLEHAPCLREPPRQRPRRQHGGLEGGQAQAALEAQHRQGHHPHDPHRALATAR